MAILGLTGGIACGKSTLASGLAGATGWEIVSADAIARHLTRSDPEVLRLIREKFGPRVIDENQVLDRRRLRDLVFDDTHLKRGLEEILHPRIRSEWTGRAAEARRDHRNLVVEIPLLYETLRKAEVGTWFDRVVVVAAPREVQIERLVGDRGVPGRIAERMIDAQMPLAEKIRLADHVVWNGGTLAAFERQWIALAGYLEFGNAQLFSE